MLAKCSLDTPKFTSDIMILISVYPIHSRSIQIYRKKIKDLKGIRVFFEKFIKRLSKIRIISILGKLSVSLICLYSLPPNEAFCLAIHLNRFWFEEKIYGHI